MTLPRHVVHHACHKDVKVVYKSNDHKLFDILSLTYQMRYSTQYCSDKPVNNDTVKMSISEEAKQNAWEGSSTLSSQGTLNMHLSNEPLLGGPPITIINMVKKTVGQGCRYRDHILPKINILNMIIPILMHFCACLPSKSLFVACNPHKAACLSSNEM